MADSMNVTDTFWTEYSRANLASCSYMIVPSVITEPIMSSETFAAWADSGVILSDTLDTCVVNVCKDGYCGLYSIDMKTWLVIAAMFSTPSGTGNHTKVYYYGNHDGTYYVQKILCGWPPTDTTIANGGYEFLNIRINGEAVTPVVTPPRPLRQRFSVQRLDGMVSLFGTTGMSRASLYDIRGRRITPQTKEVRDRFAMHDLCPASGCPSGPLLLRIDNGAHHHVFPVALFRY